jgi:hypothetical protein
MPNHVANVIRMSNIWHQPLFALTGDNQVTFDFNKIIPMNDDLNMISNGALQRLSVETVIRKVLLDGQPLDKLLPQIRINKSDRYYSMDKEEYTRLRETYKETSDEELIDFGLKCITNKLKYGSVDWYEWSWDNWGTKWNAYDTQRISKDAVSFNTAWAMPEPIVAKLAQLYPHAVIQHWWAEEFTSSGNTGYMLYKDGRIYGGYDPIGSWDAYAHYIFCWDTCRDPKARCLYSNAVYELGYGNVIYDKPYRYNYNGYSNAVYTLYDNYDDIEDMFRDDELDEDD